MTIVFKSLPDQLFDSLRDFVLVRSSDKRRFTIRIETDRDTHTLDAKHMVWLQQYTNVEMVPTDAGMYRLLSQYRFSNPAFSFCN